MRYEEIIATISEIVANDNINKEGLTLIYELDDVRHRQMDEELYIRINGNLDGFQHQELIEIELGGILVKFIKEGTKIEVLLDRMLKRMAYSPSHWMELDRIFASELITCQHCIIVSFSC